MHVSITASGAATATAPDIMQMNVGPSRRLLTTEESGAAVPEAVMIIPPESGETTKEKAKGKEREKGKVDHARDQTPATVQVLDTARMTVDQAEAPRGAQLVYTAAVPARKGNATIVKRLVT